MGILTRLGNRENYDDFCGELRMRIFILLRGNKNFGDFMLGSDEDLGNFTGESRMRIFNLLWSKNSVGKKAYCWRVSSGVFGCLPLYWEVLLGWG